MHEQIFVLLLIPEQEQLFPNNVLGYRATYAQTLLCISLSDSS